MSKSNLIEAEEDILDDDDEEEEEDEDCWINWFCSIEENELFCIVDKSYITDNFNLYGLKNIIGKDYTQAMNIMLDKPGIEEVGDLSLVTATLYGLIHARYIVTTMGLEAMHHKYTSKEFGECPRALCRGQAVLPVGLSDIPRQSIVKLYCPCCQEVYNAGSKFKRIDGSYFGTTFAHLFFLTYDTLLPQQKAEKYTPRVFGFRLHNSTKGKRDHHEVNGKQHTTPTKNQDGSTTIANVEEMFHETPLNCNSKVCEVLLKSNNSESPLKKAKLT